MMNYALACLSSFSGFMAVGYSGSQLVGHLIALPAAILLVLATDYYLEEK